MIRTLLAALALLHAAGADAKACMQPADAEALVVTLLPDVLVAVAGKCEAALPPTATLRAGAPALLARWKTESAGLETRAAAAMRVFMDGKLKGGDPAAMLSLVRTAMIGELFGNLKPTACAEIERGVTLAAPLPARNIAGLFVMLAQAGGAGKGGDLPICKAARP